MLLKISLNLFRRKQESLSNKSRKFKFSRRIKRYISKYSDPASSRKRLYCFPWNDRRYRHLVYRRGKSKFNRRRYRSRRFRNYRGRKPRNYRRNFKDHQSSKSGSKFKGFFRSVRSDVGLIGRSKNLNKYQGNKKLWENSRNYQGNKKSWENSGNYQGNKKSWENSGNYQGNKKSWENSGNYQGNKKSWENSGNYQGNKKSWENSGNYQGNKKSWENSGNYQGNKNGRLIREFKRDLSNVSTKISDMNPAKTRLNSLQFKRFYCSLDRGVVTDIDMKYVFAPYSYSDFLSLLSLFLFKFNFLDFDTLYLLFVCRLDKFLCYLSINNNYLFSGYAFYSFVLMNRLPNMYFKFFRSRFFGKFFMFFDISFFYMLELMFGRIDLFRPDLFFRNNKFFILPYSKFIMRVDFYCHLIMKCATEAFRVLKYNEYLKSNYFLSDNRDLLRFLTKKIPDCSTFVYLQEYQMILFYHPFTLYRYWVGHRKVYYHLNLDVFDYVIMKFNYTRYIIMLSRYKSKLASFIKFILFDLYLTMSFILYKGFLDTFPMFQWDRFYDIHSILLYVVDHRLDYGGLGYLNHVAYYFFDIYYFYLFNSNIFAIYSINKVFNESVMADFSFFYDVFYIAIVDYFGDYYIEYAIEFESYDIYDHVRAFKQLLYLKLLRFIGVGNFDVNIFWRLNKIRLNFDIWSIFFYNTVFFYQPQNSIFLNLNVYLKKLRLDNLSNIRSRVAEQLVFYFCYLVLRSYNGFFSHSIISQFLRDFYLKLFERLYLSQAFFGLQIKQLLTLLRVNFYDRLVYNYYIIMLGFRYFKFEIKYDWVGFVKYYEIYYEELRRKREKLLNAVH